MKSLRHSNIIVFLLPVLLLYLLYPRVNQNHLFDTLARQPILVSSFVWIPLLEISVLIVEHILPPLTIENQKKNDDTTGKQSPVPVDNLDYLIITASPVNALISASRKFILPLINLWQQFFCTGDETTGNEAVAFFPLLIILPFLRQCTLRSNPSLARGDPPSAPIA
jgi:hypothetical protein